MKKKHEKLLWYATGALALAFLLRKPVTSAAWKLWVGPKYHAALTAVIVRNDPAEISHLHEAYNGWWPETQKNFDETVRKLGLRRPW